MFIALLAVNCVAEHRYSGDGVLTDHGLFEIHHRYVVDLGDLDLANQSERTFSMSGLPRETFTIGLLVRQPAGATEPLYEIRPVSSVIVRLELSNERGELVISEEAPLNEWVWSGPVDESFQSFVYVPGAHVEVPLEDGAVRLELVGKKADEGWGTYFTPRRFGRYVAKVNVIHADPGAATYEFRVIAYGGGWK